MNNSRRNPLCIRERLVCIFASLTLIFSAWCFGGYKTWALHILFAGGLGAFLLSFLPMPRSWNGFGLHHGNFRNFKRLLFQPFFWTGLLLLAYILIQYLNPSFIQVFDEKSWWVEPVNPPMGSNLPTSIKTEYDTMNPIRVFVIRLLQFY